MLNPSNPQNFNRYGYVNNNPINFNDPTGHCADPLTGTACVVAGAEVIAITAVAFAIAYIISPAFRENIHSTADSIVLELRKQQTASEQRYSRFQQIVQSGMNMGLTPPPSSDGKGCGASAKNLGRCIVYIGLAVIFFSTAVITGGHNQDESNSRDQNLPPQPTAPSKETASTNSDTVDVPPQNTPFLNQPVKPATNLPRVPLFKVFNNQRNLYY